MNQNGYRFYTSPSIEIAAVAVESGIAATTNTESYTEEMFNM